MIVHPNNAMVDILIDSEDLNLFNSKIWTYDKMSGYTVNMTKGKKIYLHRFLLNAEKGQLVDHINGNKLDNRRTNLRFCLAKENTKNRKMSRRNTTGIKGVSFNKNLKKYEVSICVDYKTINVGYYSDIIDAKNAYNAASIKYHGKFGKLNV